MTVSVKGCNGNTVVLSLLWSLSTESSEKPLGDVVGDRLLGVAVVGCTDGWKVGATVLGKADGEAVEGLAVGWLDGLAVLGLAEGEAVEGIVVGLVDGIVLLLGRAEGATVLSTPSVPRLGTTGAAVGTQVGAGDLVDPLPLPL